MPERASPSGILIGVIALVMLGGGGWVVVKQYQKRKAQAEVRDAVTSTAERWVEARTCLTNRPPRTPIGDRAELGAQMARRRDQSMALSPPTTRYPYTCLETTGEVVDALSRLDPTLEWAAIPLSEPSSAMPHRSSRLAELAELTTQIDAAIERLWSDNRGEELPYPDHLEQPPAWDSDVLPPFPSTDECLPTAVNLDIGADNPRMASVTFELRELTLRATDTPGELEATSNERYARTTIELSIDEPVARVRACRGSDSVVHVLAGTTTQVVWVTVDFVGERLSETVIDDEALATAFRGEDGRTVHIACDEMGTSIAYATDEDARLWVCRGSRCEEATRTAVGLPRLGLARVSGRTMLLSYPPDSRVAVVDGYDHTERAVERRVVPTIDDRANPELLAEDGHFVLRLCGVELHAEPDALEFITPAR